MNRLAIARFATSAPLHKSPRFVTTLKEASKPPLEKPMAITRPFGLDTPVLLNRKVSHTYSLGALNHELFSSEAKERRQKKLDHEIAHSPFYESKSFRNVNGKIFTPPVSWFKQTVSKFFPDYYGSTLVGPTSLFDVLGPVNIVRVYSTVSGENCVNTWFKDFLEGENYHNKFKEQYPEAQVIDINIPQNWLKGFIINMSKGHIRRTLPHDRWDRYFVLPEHVFPYDIREKLKCDNMCSGYVYLLDHEGRIRWATSGYASDDELALMWKCVAGLTKEAAKVE
ncbi:mitochondrial ATPase complex subunit Atp10p [Diutina catenulata]